MAPTSSSSTERARPAWLEFVHAGTAAVCATKIVNPLDVMKTRMQLRPELQHVGIAQNLWTCARDEGVRGLQRGLGAASLLQFSNVACRFGFYDVGKRYLLRPGEDARTAHAKSMVLGAGSGLIAAVVSNPFFLLKTRFQAQSSAEGSAASAHRTYATLTEASRDILATDGLRGFYKGLPAFSARVVAASSVQLSTYDSVKGGLVRGVGMSPTHVTTHFAASLVTGAAVVLAMQPFDFACTRMMDEPPRALGGRYSHVGDVLVQAARHEGITAVYSGVLANYLRFGPYCCLVFVFLEQLRTLSDQLRDPSRTSRWQVRLPTASQ